MENRNTTARNTAIAMVVIVIIGLAVYGVTRQSATQNPATDQVISTSTGSQATTTATSTAVKVFYVAVEDNGKSGKKIGCGDSVVAVTRTVPYTQTPLRAAIDLLLSEKRHDIAESGLINALYQSNLKVTSLSIVGGRATVKLEGSTSLGGVCDEPRFVAQLQETVSQFPTVSTTSIFINNTSLETVFSQK